ncbi:isopenicillin N synthase family dioxygenase [Flavisphingomonas formosensis]|uniref:isopenicillin N synthase family dioxygenase n=1 Tax=Flavisphingomonas formosensis TaxID=861534 RepID=UPI0012F927C9|nr:2-oxoglutarate and iron-dependent oxygenase domain-containing protein [Sphingomonas formosensis]
MPLASLSLRDDPASFAAALGEAFARHGFAIVADHGIDPGIIARAEAEMRAFFALPVAVKRRHHLEGTGGARGYTPFGIETAKDADDFDLKEFWHVGRELPPRHPYEGVMQPNVWPGELPGFRDVMLRLFAAFDMAGARLLDAIGRHLGLSPHFLSDATRDGNSVLRLLHYPPVPAGAFGIRAGAHEDINAITLLLGAEEAGLEILDREGNWLPVAPRPGELVVNVGDMLQRLTNGRLRSTTHRVRNPAPERRGVSRWSMPFFLHFRPDFLIETLPSCIGPDGDHPAPITANDYLLERLREIRLL